MRHRRNNNKNKKQDGSQGRDVDESELIDVMLGRTVVDGAAHRRKGKAGSALIHVRGSTPRHGKEDEADAGSALRHVRGSALRDVLNKTSRQIGENIAVGDVLVGLCYFPHRVRQMLYSYLDQAITQTSLFA